MKKILIIGSTVFILFGCYSGGYDSVQDERWAKTLKHAYREGWVDGANSANEEPTFELLKLRCFKDSVHYAQFVDRVFKKSD